MKLLVDTHVFLSFISGESNLSSRAVAALTEPTNELYLSVASVWEIVTKYQIGKLSLPLPIQDFVGEQIRANRISVLPIRSAHVFQLLRLPLLHRDPFDRILLAQSLEENAPIVSRDKLLLKYPVEVVW